MTLKIYLQTKETHVHYFSVYIFRKEHFKHNLDIYKGSCGIKKKTQCSYYIYNDITKKTTGIQFLGDRSGIFN